jgi:hypothetical protein
MPPPASTARTAEEKEGKAAGPVTPANQETFPVTAENLSATYAEDTLTGEVQPLQEGRAEDAEELADPLLTDVRESEKNMRCWMSRRT